MLINKADLLDAEDQRVAMLQNVFPGAVAVSAANGYGVNDLLVSLDQHLGKSAILVQIDLPPIFGAARAWLYQNAQVKSLHFDELGHEKILVSIDPVDHARFSVRWPSLDVKLMTHDSCSP